MMISSLIRSKADNIDPKMRGEDEDDSNWFSQWEEQLPPPDELMPLSQSLITPDLALAFDIPASDGDGDGDGDAHPLGPASNPNPSSNPNSAASSSLLGPGPPHPPSSDLLDSSDLVGPAQDEPARTLKRPRLVWTPQLHKRFVDAVAHLGIKNAVPKTIMQLMSVEGLTRENVASHLQKYRLYLKRMQGLSGPGGPAGPVSPAEAADHRLFASAPVPHHFLQRGPPTPADHFLPFVPVPPLQHHHHHPHHPQMAAAAAQYYNSRQFGSPPGGQFDQGFYSRPVHQMMGPVPSTGSYGGEEDIGGGRKKVLTLFPTGED